MNLSTVEIPTAQARERALEYSREAKRITDPAQRREFEQIARAYRAAAKEGVQMIALTATVAAGGTQTRTLVHGKGRDWERREQYLLPNLAVCRWTAAFCYSLGVQQHGAVEFIDSLGHDYRYRSGRIQLDTQLELPDGYRQGRSENHDRSAWSAMVPIVPPKHRPARGMGDRLVLWEVENWTWATVPAPPGDPALLRHVAGDLYAVEAVWDLSPLEQLVLSERRL